MKISKRLAKSSRLLQRAAFFVMFERDPWQIASKWSIITLVANEKCSERNEKFFKLIAALIFADANPFKNIFKVTSCMITASKFSLHNEKKLWGEKHHSLQAKKKRENTFFCSHCFKSRKVMFESERLQNQIQECETFGIFFKLKRLFSYPINITFSFFGVSVFIKVFSLKLGSVFKLFLNIEISCT